MKRATGFILVFHLLLSAGTAQKQTSGKSATDAARLTALKVTGTSRYTDKEILSASGLQIGQPAADGDFKEAVRLLGDSGLFSEVVYSYSASGASVKLSLKLADIDQHKLVRARFENFVWFTDEELLAAVQRRVPLFKQFLPLGGSLADRVEEALQALIAEKHVPGRVDYLRSSAGPGMPIDAIDYKVEEVDIRIRNVEFPGASPEQAALLKTAAHRLVGASYVRSALAATAKFDLLPVYLQRGYLKAAFGVSDAHVLPQPAAAADTQDLAEIQVDAILPVTPGKVYSASRVDWKGNSALAAGDLAPLLHLTPGQPVDAVRLLSDVENVGKLYRSRGYMAVQIKPEAEFDDEKSTVHYDLNIIEGDLYRMGELEILGLDTQATARMRTAWTLHQGQPYNADYLKQFLSSTGQLLPRGVQWAVTTHVTPDAKDKTVDVEIRFKQQ
jgi:hypothetical protein